MTPIFHLNKEALNVGFKSDRMFTSSRSFMKTSRLPRLPFRATLKSLPAPQCV